MPVSNNRMSPSASVPAPSTLHTPSENAALSTNFKTGDFDIGFSAYMQSEMGENAMTNCDNYYLNGIFMKNFKFTNMKKSIENIGEAAVFAVVGSSNSDEASRSVLRHLDSKREWLVTSKNLPMLKKRLSDVLHFCNNMLLQEGAQVGARYDVSLAVAVYFKQSVVYCVCGTGALFFLKGAHAKSAAIGCQSLGLAPLVATNLSVRKFNKVERMVMCSTGVKNALPIETLMYSVASEEEPKGIVARVFNQMIYNKTSDATCLAVRVIPAGGLRTGTLLVAIGCIFAIAIIAILMLL